MISCRSVSRVSQLALLFMVLAVLVWLLVANPGLLDGFCIDRHARHSRVDKKGRPTEQEKIRQAVRKIRRQETKDALTGAQREAVGGEVFGGN